MENENYGDFRTLKVYQLAYSLAMEIFDLTKAFPKEEKFALVDQIRRSSRAVCSNIAEGYRKRIYPNHFRSKMTDADGECAETSVWLDFSKDCQYIMPEKHAELRSKYDQVGKMLGGMANNPEKFLPK